MDETLLMIPGPTRVAPRVLKAMSENIVNHRSALFGEILTETNQMMSELFMTDNKSYLITGSGTAAMEAALANTISKGDRVLNIVGGKFGQRFMQITETHGGIPVNMEVEWGHAVNPSAVREFLEENDDIKAVTVVHNETSTGATNPIEELGKILEDYDTLYVVDTVSSLGGDDVFVDGYGIDICVTGSQKCLAAPPGMAAITLSDDLYCDDGKLTVSVASCSVSSMKIHFAMNLTTTGTPKNVKTTGLLECSGELDMDMISKLPDKVSKTYIDEIEDIEEDIAKTRVF
jgi:aspartate aminotransferase-like enzyme